jgi:hypothetical protein
LVIEGADDFFTVPGACAFEANECEVDAVAIAFAFFAQNFNLLACVVARLATAAVVAAGTGTVRVPDDGSCLAGTGCGTVRVPDNGSFLAGTGCGTVRVPDDGSCFAVFTIDDDVKVIIDLLSFVLAACTGTGEGYAACGVGREGLCFPPPTGGGTGAAVPDTLAAGGMWTCFFFWVTLTFVVVDA